MSLNIVPLKDLCNNYKTDIVDGPFGANLKREHYKEEGIPVLKIQNIKSFNITLKKMDYVDQAKFDELRRHSYINGDIVMTKLGNPLGESAIVEGLDEGLIVADLVRIRTQKIDTQYLCYHLNSPVTSAYINSQQKGTTRPRVRIAVVRDLPIYTPSLAEQQRIVAILDQAFADIEKARANAEQNLKNARELFDSYLQQVFSQRGEGWEKKQLGDAVVVERGSSPRPIKQFRTESGDGVNWIKIGDAKEGQKYITSTKEKITKEGAEKSRFVDVGDFILSNSMSFGRPYIMSIQGYIHDGWFVLRLPDEIDSEYFYYLLSSPYLATQFQGLAAGAIVKNISGDLVKKAMLPIPPLKTQKDIVEKSIKFSGEITSLQVIYQHKLKSLDELKKSLLQKAFIGELTKNKGMAA